MQNMFVKKTFPPNLKYILRIFDGKWLFILSTRITRMRHKIFICYDDNREQYKNKTSTLRHYFKVHKIYQLLNYSNMFAWVMCYKLKNIRNLYISFTFFRNSTIYRTYTQNLYLLFINTLFLLLFIENVMLFENEIET